MNSVTPGIHAFLATYPGQGEFTPATSVKIYVLVNKYVVTLTLSSSPNPSLVGQAVKFTATISSVNGIPPGPVVVSEGSTTLANLNPDGSGVATFTTNSLAAGPTTSQPTIRGTRPISQLWLP